jgi:hypothetical protein
MTANIGTIDRAIRVILGIVLLALPFMSGWAIFGSTAATVISMVAGVVMLATSSLKFCPMYRIFGIRTCKI